MWQWCINHAIFLGTSLLFVTLLIIAIYSFTPSNTSDKRMAKNEESIQEEQKEGFVKTEDGYIIYDAMENVTMQKGEIRTFRVPLGVQIRRKHTEGVIEKHSTSRGHKYVLVAKTNATFDLVWVIEKGFEHKVKPKS